MSKFTEWLKNKDGDLFTYLTEGKKKKWIQGAIKHPGALKAAAKEKGESESEYCENPPSGKAEKRCNLRNTLKGLNKSK